MTHTILLLPGDGIGPEVVAAARLVLDAAAARFGIALRYETALIGGAAIATGQGPLPEATLDKARNAKAILLGAVGDPRFDHLPPAERAEGGLLRLRKTFGLYANLRPAVVYPGLEHVGPFRSDRVAGTDILFIRELTGGLYFGEPRGFDADGTAAFNTLRYNADEIRRVTKFAFEAARLRRKKVTSVDKQNVLEVSQLWRRIATEVGKDFPDVQLEHLYVDAMAMILCLDPRRFDVVVTENLFGDILSDEAGALAGSLGLLPSASLGEGPGVYEPVHGSAPTLAGQDIANPVGAIASAALLLRYSFERDDAACAIERAIEDVIASGIRTADVVAPGQQPTSTSAVARAVAERVSAAH
ncbi:MAG: 3-isopropylmalate dehydrogenase [Vicinamibacterales bacterium]